MKRKLEEETVSAVLKQGLVNNAFVYHEKAPSTIYGMV